MRLLPASAGQSCSGERASNAVLLVSAGCRAMTSRASTFVIAEDKRSTYEGEMKDGEEHGQGVLTWPMATAIKALGETASPMAGGFTSPQAASANSAAGTMAAGAARAASPIARSVEAQRPAASEAVSRSLPPTRDCPENRLPSRIRSGTGFFGSRSPSSRD